MCHIHDLQHGDRRKFQRVLVCCMSLGADGDQPFCMGSIYGWAEQQ